MLYNKVEKYNECHFFSFRTLGSIYTSDLLGVNYSLNNGLYCTKVHLQLLFGQLLSRLKSSIMSCVPIFCDCVDWKVHAIVHGW